MIDEATLRSLIHWAWTDLAQTEAAQVQALIDEVRRLRAERACIVASLGWEPGNDGDIAIAIEERDDARRERDRVLGALGDVDDPVAEIGTLKARVAELERELQDRDDAAWDRSR